MTEANVQKYEITVDGKTYTIELGDVSTSPVEVIVNGEPKSVAFAQVEEAPAEPEPASDRPAPAREPEAPSPKPVPSGDGEIIRAPMPGKILSVSVSVGDRITEGETFCTLEAMKMEMPVSSTVSGTVSAVHIAPGKNVANDDPLITVA